MYLERLLLSVASEDKLVKNICVLTMINKTENPLVCYAFITYILATVQDFVLHLQNVHFPREGHLQYNHVAN